MTRIVISTLFLSIFFASCGEQKSNRQDHLNDFSSNPAVKASKDISTSFDFIQDSATKNPNSSEDFILDQQSYLIGIKKSELDKEYLLRTNITKGGSAPTFHSLKSRVVAFSKKGQKIFLLEATQGHTHHESLPQKLILAEFDIKKEESDAVFFDFNQGMAKIYSMSEWFASDIQKTPNFNDYFTSITIENSYLDHVGFIPERNQFIIHQVARATWQNVHEPLQVNYALSPYETNPNFIPSRVKAENSRTVGFFETNPQIAQETSTYQTMATKFDISRKIVFALSQNTPHEYRAPIKEGILYWNKIFGKNVIEVIDAPQGEVAPSYQFNMIQWIDWDRAGYAYADAQADPRSGEVYNAQIFLTSSFATGTRKKAQKILQNLLLNEDKNFSKETEAQIRSVVEASSLNLQATNRSDLRPLSFPKIHLTGFNHQDLCSHYKLDKHLLSLSQLLSSNADDRIFQEVSEHYLRSTVAHEVGHILGLRHNFAGHLATSYKLENRENIFKKLVFDKTLSDDIVVTSSVMDYLLFEESIILGYQIKQNKVLPYDQMAIEMLYFDKSKSDYAKKTLFCTDSDLGTYIDCDRHVTGRSIIEYSKWATNEAIKAIPSLLSNYIFSNETYKNASDTIDHFNISSILHSVQTLRTRESALASISAKQRSVIIDSQYEKISEINIDEANKKYYDYISNEIQTNGGWTSILGHTTENFQDLLIKSFYDISQKAHGEKLDQLEDKTKAKLSETITNYVEKLYESLMLVDSYQILTQPKISNEQTSSSKDSIDDEFMKYLEKKSFNTIFSALENKIKSNLKVKSVKATISSFEHLVLYKAIAAKNPKLLELKFNSTNTDSFIHEQLLQEFATQAMSQLLTELTKSIDTKSLFKTLGITKPEDFDEDSFQEEVYVTVIVPINLTSFKNSTVIRSAASQYLASENSESLSYGMPQKNLMFQKLLEVIYIDLRGYDLSKINYAEQEKELNIWLQENLALLASLKV